MARDCTVNKGVAFTGDPVGGGPGGPPSQAMVKSGGFDSEYASLMAELGETGKGPGADSGRGQWGGGVGDITTSSSNIPPWRRPEVWQSALGALSTQNTSYRPPQPGYSGYPGGGGAPSYGQPGYSGFPQQAPGSGYPQSQDYSNYAQYYQGQYAQQTSS
jgi:splicing factor 1